MENFASLVAMSVIHTAEHDGYLTGPLTVLEALAEPEKELCIGMLKQLHLHLNRANCLELTGEEIVSIYTFVLAKAAEAVSAVVNGNPMELELLGMLDGKVPYYCDPRLESFCHATTLPGDFAKTFHDFNLHYGDALTKEGVEPVLVLMESLKWTWRICVHVCYELLKK